VEDVNYEDGDPRKPFRELYGYGVSAKRYCLFEGKHARKIVDAKAHGIGYLMSPIRKRNKDENHNSPWSSGKWSCRMKAAALRAMSRNGWIIRL
jgi:hypothetical protein